MGDRPKPDTVMLHLGAELRRLRVDQRYSREQLIERMGAAIHPQTLSSYENGVRQISVTRLADVCHALGVDAHAVMRVAVERAGREMCPTCQGMPCPTCGVSRNG